MQFGYEGIGLFFTTLEKLANQEKPLKTSVLKTQLNVGKKLEKCWKFMESIELLSSNNGETFNKQLLNYAGKYKSKNEKNAKRVAQWRENQLLTENVTHYESITLPLRNADKVNESKVKESKVKESKAKESKVFTPPTIFDVIAYFKENGFTEPLARRAFTHYNCANWCDSKGNKVISWKQKMHTVWMTDENRLPEQNTELSPLNQPQL